MKMAPPYVRGRWYHGGQLIEWIAPEHCLLLVGYDDNNYIFNDPQYHKNTYYAKSAVEVAYAGMKSQAVVVENGVSEDAYNAGVRMGSFEGKNYLDYTIPLNNLFQSAKQRAEEHRCRSQIEYASWWHEQFPAIPVNYNSYWGELASSFLWFYNQVNHNCEWDIKRELRWKESLPGVPFPGASVESFLFNGELASPEAMGNIMFGYIGRATGFGSITLRWGGGVAKLGNLSSPLLSTPPEYGDDEADSLNVLKGYDMFNADYPNYANVGFDGVPVNPIFIQKINETLGTGY